MDKVLAQEAKCGWPQLYYHTIDELIRSINATKVAEIGVAYGLHMRHLLRTFPALSYTGVDPYRAGYDPTDTFCADVASMFGLEHDHQAAMTMLGDTVAEIAATEFPARVVRLMRMTSLRAAAELRASGALFDLVFVDGDHTYENALADLRAWWPLVRPGGIMCGDDYLQPAVRKAVQAFAAQIGQPALLKWQGKYPTFYFLK